MIRLIAKIISLLVLVALTVPPCMYFMNKMSLDQVKNVMLISTIVWFVTASVWMWQNNSAS
jgi:hypothetical protein